MSELPHPKFLIGWRIYLRAIEERDLDFLTQSINRPEVRQFIMSVWPISRAGEQRWWERLLDRSSNHIALAIVLKDGDRVIGTIGLGDINWIHSTATTGSMIGDPELWNHGYGTEAKMLLLDYAFHTLNLRKICSEVLDGNKRSMAALENCGYQEDGGPRKAQVFKNGEYLDRHQFAVFREDFQLAWDEYQKKHQE